MSKLNLVAMSYDRDRLLNALQRTGATEVKTHYEVENTSPVTENSESLSGQVNRIDGALNLLAAEVSAYNKDNKVKTDDLKDGFSVSYREFIGANSLKEECDAVVDKINLLFDERRTLAAEKTKLERAQSTSEIYACVTEKFGEFASTTHTKVKLGTIPLEQLEPLIKETGLKELCSLTSLNVSGDTALISFVYHKSEEGAEELLQNAGFSSCPSPAELRRGAEYRNNAETQ